MGSSTDRYTCLGSLYDEETGSYLLSFLVAGGFIAFSGVICLPLARLSDWENRGKRETVFKLDIQASGAAEDAGNPEAGRSAGRSGELEISV